MIELPASLFLNVFGDLCVSGTMRGRATLDIASEEYYLGLHELNRTLYSLTVSSKDFPRAEDGTEFTLNSIVYKAVKPPIIDQDALVFVCKKK